MSTELDDNIEYMNSDRYSISKHAIYARNLFPEKEKKREREEEKEEISTQPKKERKRFSSNDGGVVPKVVEKREREEEEEEDDEIEEVEDGVATPVKTSKREREEEEEERTFVGNKEKQVKYYEVDEYEEESELNPKLEEWERHCKEVEKDLMDLFTSVVILVPTYSIRHSSSGVEHSIKASMRVLFNLYRKMTQYLNVLSDKTSKENNVKCIKYNTGLHDMIFDSGRKDGIESIQDCYKIGKDTIYYDNVDKKKLMRLFKARMYQ